MAMAASNHSPIQGVWEEALDLDEATYSEKADD
eukprot:CAMPEP_0114660326 /NCGR_PEP_ID=MMETSP0191-20121206/19772_1 /TAXON_ID=126664 /ORGANISM="Sorites sp." /LENGTH=32 /DNA_ID= /DNA_START= /DNA_END= /DNA_ORIENTATION=